MDECRGDLTAHTLAEGQLPCRGLQQVAKVEHFREPVEVLSVLVRRDRVDVPQQLEGVADRHVPPESGALSEDHAEVRDVLPAAVSMEFCRQSRIRRNPA